MEYGVYQARRAWLTKQNILNAQSLEKLYFKSYGKRS